MSHLQVLNDRNTNLLNNNAKLRADLAEYQAAMRSIKFILQDSSGCDEIIKQRILDEVDFVLNKE